MKAKAIPELSQGNRERFWASVEKGEACWQWKGPTTTASGFKYGVFCIYANGKKNFLRPHRVAWTLLRGPLGEDQTIDHLCLNKLCVNPAHLEPVTQAVNSQRQWTPDKRCTPAKRRADIAAAQRRWREKNPEKAKAQARKYYFEGGGKEKKRERWEKFKAEYHALEPPREEDHGYVS